MKHEIQLIQDGIRITFSGSTREELENLLKRALDTLFSRPVPLSRAWQVESRSRKGTNHIVRLLPSGHVETLGYTCTCEDFTHRNSFCWHIEQAYYHMDKAIPI